jgi:hypothetical protein
MKKSFTGPVWLLLIFGILQLGMSMMVFRLAIGRYSSGFGGLREIGVAFLFYILIWPMLLFAEALVYWLIRRRNRAHMLSWTHAVTFCFAFILNTSVFVLGVLHSPIAGGMSTRGGRNVLIGTYGSLVILAHVAFVQVLILAFRKAKPKMGDGGSSENLLDDVVL